VAGCLVERVSGRHQKKTCPRVDAVIGTKRDRSDSSGFAKGIDEPAAGSAPYLYHDPHAAHSRHAAPFFAYMKIAEGCDHPCTFLRDPPVSGGSFASRRFRIGGVGKRRGCFGQRGCGRSNLIGQDTTCYGRRFRTERWLGGVAGPAGADRDAAPEMGFRFFICVSEQGHAEETARYDSPSMRIW